MSSHFNYDDDSTYVNKIKSTSCQESTCRRVVGGDEKSVDERSVDGLSPHRLFDIIGKN